MLYFVRPNDSLQTIAEMYHTSPDSICEMNHMDTYRIYVNQPLFIPIRGMNGGERFERAVETYQIKQGDSLFQIAREYNTTVDSIKQLNNLESSALTVGQEIIIPQYTEAVLAVPRVNIRTEPSFNSEIIIMMDQGARLPVTGTRGGWYRVQLYNGQPGWVNKSVTNLVAHDGSKPILSTLGYYTLQEGPALPGSYQSFVNNTEGLSQLGLFLFQISLENPTMIDKFGEFADNEIVVLKELAHRNNIKALAVVHNLLYESGGQETSKQVVETMLSTPENRTAFVNSLVELVERYGLDGVDLDIEDVYEKDRDRLALLYEEIGEVFREKGYFFSTAIPSKTGPDDPSEFAKPFDYERIGNAADQVVIMLYNEHGWPGSGPGPVVSYGRMKEVLTYASSVMPKEKILAAVSVFGFDFNLTTGKNQYVTYQGAIDLANKYNSEIIFDEETKTPMFSYTDEEGNAHEVWFEDSRSILAKAELADELGVKGLALWRLGMEDPAIWNVLNENVVVKKS
ncbi:glycosyl hydrolase [Bacillus solimangrovi]|uniref:Glycosyl hydrolase n=1 Tax=Bacillus solimangrovi TaxID=1305675 RepID=A0A1E5LCX1_9BACI|nr:glycosyl hydrolase [Bacillus solimangrovi]